MGTKHYCDHCGNTIRPRDLNAMQFGPFRARELYAQQMDSSYKQALYQAQMQTGIAGSAGISNGIGGGGAAPTVPPIIDKFPIISIDLCVTCVPIWYARVQNITKASDPDVPTS